MPRQKIDSQKIDVKKMTRQKIDSQKIDASKN
jgi:hypothetical protein